MTLPLGQSARADGRRGIYLDHNSTTPMRPEVTAAMRPLLDGAFGNPSLDHWASAPARTVLEEARAAVAGAIGARPDEIVFTSGATEANNQAIWGVLGTGRVPSGHAITCATEHDAVLKPLRAMARGDVSLTVLPVDGTGRIDPDDLQRAIRPDTRLISLMRANNETGTLQPVIEVARVARAHGIPVHCDAAQAVGKVAMDVTHLDVDFLAFTAHKIGGPKGIGALYVRRGRRLRPLMHGGHQERGRRPGTESALLAAGFGTAAKLAAEVDVADPTVGLLRDRFWAGLKDHFGSAVVANGHPLHRTPNTLNVSFPGHVGADVLAALPHVAASTGSACHGGCVTLSHVLMAMGASTDVGMGAIRFSLGRTNTEAEIDAVVTDLAHVMRPVHAALPLKRGQVTQSSARPDATADGGLTRPGEGPGIKQPAKTGDRTWHS